MAHERKAGEIGPPSAKMRSAIPPAKKDDLEDVAWALQTAEATWARGDHADALKWIRRAAEAASEAERDDRALELAKAAADVASLLAERPAPTPPPPLATTPEAPRVKPTSRPPPALATGRVPGSAPTPAKVGIERAATPARGAEVAHSTARADRGPPGLAARRASLVPEHDRGDDHPQRERRSPPRAAHEHDERNNEETRALEQAFPRGDRAADGAPTIDRGD